MGEEPQQVLTPDGDLSGEAMTARFAEMADQFLHEPVGEKKSLVPSR